MEEKSCFPCGQDPIEKLPPCPLQCMSPKCKAFQRTTTIDWSRTPVVWLMGGPGTDKGVLSQKIAAKYGFVLLSIGDLLRAESKSDSDRAKCLTTVLERRDLVPNDVVCDILNETMLAKAGQAKGFLINNFPRDKAQGMFFEKKIAPVSVIIYLEVSSEKLLQFIPTDDQTPTDPQVKTFLENYEQILEHWPNKIKRISPGGTPDAMFLEISQYLDPLVA